MFAEVALGYVVVGSSATDSYDIQINPRGKRTRTHLLVHACVSRSTQFLSFGSRCCLLLLRVHWVASAWLRIGPCSHSRLLTSLPSCLCLVSQRASGRPAIASSQSRSNERLSTAELCCLRSERDVEKQLSLSPTNFCLGCPFTAQPIRTTHDKSTPLQSHFMSRSRNSCPTVNPS